VNSVCRCRFDSVSMIAMIKVICPSNGTRKQRQQRGAASATPAPNHDHNALGPLSACWPVVPTLAGSLAVVPGLICLPSCGPSANPMRPSAVLACRVMSRSPPRALSARGVKGSGPARRRTCRRLPRQRVCPDQESRPVTQTGPNPCSCHFHAFSGSSDRWDQEAKYIRGVRSEARAQLLPLSWVLTPRKRTSVADGRNVCGIFQIPLTQWIKSQRSSSAICRVIVDNQGGSHGWPRRSLRPAGFQRRSMGAGCVPLSSCTSLNSQRHQSSAMPHCRKLIETVEAHSRNAFSDQRSRGRGPYRRGVPCGRRRGKPVRRGSQWQSFGHGAGSPAIGDSGVQPASGIKASISIGLLCRVRSAGPDARVDHPRHVGEMRAQHASPKDVVFSPMPTRWARPGHQHFAPRPQKFVRDAQGLRGVREDLKPRPRSDARAIDQNQKTSGLQAFFWVAR